MKINRIKLLAIGASTLAVLAYSSTASAQFDIGGPNGVLIGGGYGLRIGGPNGVQFGGGQGAKFGGPSGVQFGGGQGAKFGGPNGVQFGGGQGAKFGGPGGLQIGGTRPPAAAPVVVPGQPVEVVEPPARRRRPQPVPTTLYYPKEAEKPLAFTLNDHPFEIQPGQNVTLRGDRRWLLRFEAAPDGQQRHYVLPQGTYTFKQKPDGWNLYRSQPPRPAAELLPPPVEPGTVTQPLVP